MTNIMPFPSLMFCFLSSFLEMEGLYTSPSDRNRLGSFCSSTLHGTYFLLCLDKVAKVLQGKELIKEYFSRCTEKYFIYFFIYLFFSFIFISWRLITS